VAERDRESVCVMSPSGRWRQRTQFKAFKFFNLSVLHEFIGIGVALYASGGLGLRGRHLHGGPKKASRKHIDRFPFFTGIFCGTFVIKWLLNIPPHHNCVATLPCEI